MASKRTPARGPGAEIFTSSWLGTFRYQISDPGCHWKYDLPKKWLLEPAKRSFHEIGTKISELLPDLRKSLVGVKGLSTYTLPTRFAFLSWATANKGDTSAVVDGTALMLNHVVSSGTIQSFKILSSFVEGHLTVQIQNLPPGAPCWFYLKLPTPFAILDEYMLAFPRWFFKTDPNGFPYAVLERPKLEHAVSLIRSHRILNEFTILNYTRKQDCFVIQVKNAIKVAPYERGRLCGCIPIAGPADKKKREREPELVATPEVVVTSPVVAKALEQLSRVWGDRFAKSVLISAPPGSGKENFATSVPFGQGRPSENFSPISLADDSKSLARQLYGKRREDGSIELGLLAMAAQSAVFLDEVHQPPNEADSLRPSLLRPLESGEYFPVEGNKPERIDNVIFVLATSTRVSQLGKVKPKDFWTRMSHVVSIKHPLEFSDKTGAVKQADVIEAFFKFFWWDRTRSFYDLNPDRLGKAPTDAARLIPTQQATAILRSKDLETAATAFAIRLLQVLRSRGLTANKCSIRGLRSMTSRLFSIVANEIASGRDDQWVSCFKKHLPSVVEEILPMALIANGGSRSKPRRGTSV